MNDDEFYSPEIGEQLGKFQPYLQFKTSRGWMESGLITGTMSESFVGFYRVTPMYFFIGG